MPSIKRDVKEEEEDVREIYLSPYHFEDSQFYPGPKFVWTPKHRQCPGTKVKWYELLIYLTMNGMKSSCPLCYKKQIDFSNLIGSIAPNYHVCYCDKLCLIRTAKKTGIPYASCMTQMGREDRCNYFSRFN
jgi:hypothetical protein